ncbi:MAG TPA: hypothetical protein PLZ12_08445 [Saprospiraceae bacterium]|nr:hypothetical protein [Saprospiraceae bacterium]
MRYIQLIVFLLCIPLAMQAQTPMQDVVYLKNGAVIKGVILDYRPGGQLVIDIGNGREVTFQDSEVAKIQQEPFSNQGKTDGTVDFLFLYNGSIFKGEIVSETPTQTILKLKNGEKVTFNAKEIKAVQRNQPADSKPTLESGSTAQQAYDYHYISMTKKPKEKKEYAFRERGWFNRTSFTMPNGVYLGEAQFGAGLHNLTGFQFNRMLGAGIGLGFDTFNPEGGENVASVYGEAQSFLTKTKTAPFVSFAAGYGFAFRNRNNFITKAEGGLRFHPAVGLRLGADKDLNLMLDVGYIFQTATYTREFDFFDQTEVRKVDFRRFTLRLGAMF